MIYSGLEFGQYFELERNTKCHNVLLALTPATRMAFIFIQMYFIFLNNEVNIPRRSLRECMCEFSEWVIEHVPASDADMNKNILPVAH